MDSDDNSHLDQIQKRLKENAYFINPHSDANAAKDIEFLLALLKKRDERIAQLDKKAALLGQQVQELNAEIENVKSDFGGMR